MAVWIKLEKCSGEHSVFSTIDSKYNHGQYHFSIRSCGVRWFHRNVFEIQTKDKVELKKWIHIAVTYNGSTKKARVG